MTISEATIHRLTDRLDSGDDSPLTDDERSLLRAALNQLAADEQMIARQQRLLRLHGESADRIDAIAHEALTSLNDRLTDPPPAVERDFQAAQAAREQLLREMTEANSARATLGAALTFAKRVAEAVR